jgi:hypothetical protein
MIILGDIMVKYLTLMTFWIILGLFIVFPIRPPVENILEENTFGLTEPLQEKKEE